MRELILAAVLFGPLGAAAAEPLGTLTILEGEALVYRGGGRLHAAEGLRLAPGDIVETAKSTFMQIELADRSVAQFGPSTRVMFNTSTARRPERWMYLMDGWAKLAGVKREGGSAIDLRTPLLEIPAGPAVVVLRATPAEATLFVERGDIKLTERPVAGAPVVFALKAGDHYKRKAGNRGAANPGGMQAFVQDMPRPFRDSLPLRAERFRDQALRPRDAPGFDYADVETWLKAEPTVRRPLVQRWRSKAREPAFRAALVSNLNAHPEWDPVLFPEKYLPKPASAPRTAAASAPAR
jgi:hypothetical protein